IQSFARFVILGEGASERLVIARLAEAMGVPLDASFVPVVPLAGRYVDHFWTLLRDLRIPYATLVDLDLGRAHGGAAMLRRMIEKLRDHGNDLAENYCVVLGLIDPADLPHLTDDALLNDNEAFNWVSALQQEGVFFSFPLDIDFAMLAAFPNA